MSQKHPPTSASQLNRYIDFCLTSTNITNGLVLALVRLHKRKFSHIFKALQDRSGIPPELSLLAFQMRVKALEEELAKHRKNLKRGGKHAVKLLEQPFKPSMRKHRISENNSCPPLTNEIKKLSTNCGTCQVLSAELASSTSTLDDLTKIKEDYEGLKSQRMKYEPRRINQTFKRKDKQLSELRAKVRHLKRGQEKVTKLKDENLELRGSLRKVRKQKTYMKSYYTKNDLLKRITALKNQIDLLEDENVTLRDELLIHRKAAMEVKSSQEYSANTRVCVYHCLDHQVPVERVSSLICNVVADMTGIKIQESTMPSTTTVARMALEMGVVSDIRTVAALHEAKDTTLGWDATTIGGSHLNELHVSTGEKTLSLGVRELPGGKTTDYHQSIMETLKDAVSSYAECQKMDTSAALKECIGNISNTLTDRVAVNHCVVNELKTSFDHDLLELNCNIHPLDGLANAARSTLKKEQPRTTGCFGQDAPAVNYMRAISKIRFKAGSGSPATMKSYMKQNGMQLSLLVRYVGNRMHVIFHLAGVLVFFNDQLIDYLSNVCPLCWRQAVINDARNKTIQSHLLALGLYGKVLTGPWMTTLYHSEGNASNLDFILDFKTAVKTLEDIQTTPSLLFTSDVDVFGKPLQEDPILGFLRTQEASSETTHVIKRLAESFLCVLHRQLCRYLVGDLSDPSEALKDQARSAPAHNMFSERALGMTDAQIRRAPNATTEYIDAKVKTRVNNTMEWLSSLDDQHRDSTVKYAMRRARSLSGMQKNRKDDREKIVQVRLQATRQKRDKAKRSKLEKTAKLWEQSGEVTFGDLKDLQSDENIWKTVVDIIKTPSSVVNQELQHLWLEESGEQWFNGRIIEAKTKRKQRQPMTVYVISYWQDNETDAESEDYDIPRAQFLVDLILGDLCLM